MDNPTLQVGQQTTAFRVPGLHVCTLLGHLSMRRPEVSSDSYHSMLCKSSAKSHSGHQLQVYSLDGALQQCLQQCLQTVCHMAKCLHNAHVLQRAPLLLSSLLVGWCCGAVLLIQIKRTEGVSTTDIVGRMLTCTRANPHMTKEVDSQVGRSWGSARTMGCGTPR